MTSPDSEFVAGMVEGLLRRFPGNPMRTIELVILHVAAAARDGGCPDAGTFADKCRSIYEFMERQVPRAPRD